MRFLFIFPFLFLSCSALQLSVFTEYVSIESLPSYQIGTPDPRLYCPDIGEKLHIKWSIPYGCHYQSLDLHLSLRFMDGTDKEVWVPLETPTGVYVYELINKEFLEKGGLFTYLIELYGNGIVLKQWRHQLYAERIKFEGE